jgi:membrane protein
MLSTLLNRLNYLLWEIKLHELGKVQAFLVRMLRILYGAGSDISRGLPTLRAMGLVYTTLLSLVPLLAVGVSVLKGFGVHNQLEPFLLKMLEPLGEKGSQVTEQILGFVDNMKLGVLGSLGLMFLIFTVLSLVKKIESAFNYTWRIRSSRNIVQRFSNYLSVILIGPLMLFVATSIGTSFHTNFVQNRLIPLGAFGEFLMVAIGSVLPYVLTLVSFTLVYLLIPNTRVRFLSAFYGAVFATVTWKAVGVMFKAFIVNSTNYTAIYSGFAILIIFMIWIHVSWLIVLAGASVSYYHQNPDRIGDFSRFPKLSARMREKMALAIMQLVGLRFDRGEKALTAKGLSRSSGVSEQAMANILEELVRRGLLITSGEDCNRYQPATSLERITLKQILDAAREADEKHILVPGEITAAETVNDTVSRLDQAITESVGDRTLKDLINKDPIN